MPTPKLTVADLQGRRSVAIDKPLFTIGRRATSDLQVAGRDVSRDHAKISLVESDYRLSDCGSRFGTFVNGEQLTSERTLKHGDKVRLGQTEAVELVFLTDADQGTTFRSGSSSLPDLPQMAAILNGLRAVGSGRVLDEVLTLVLDSALDVTSAERGFVMLAAPTGQLEFKIGRERGRKTLSGTLFETSDKIPREVFQTGRSRIVADLLDDSNATAHEGTIAIGIRHVLCVPLRVTSYAAAGSDQAKESTIGVLYLDSRERGAILSSATRVSLEAFATQAALAIDSARMYAQAAEQARLERDLKVAAEIQHGLLPEPRFSGASFDVAAVSIPCRTVGGDFFDYLDVPPDGFGFTLGDVAGKGPPAALLAVAVQSSFAAHAPVAVDPAQLMARVNVALLRRAIEARFATMFHAVLYPDGRLRYSNAGQEAPIVLRAGGAMEELEVGGPVLGLLSIASYEFAEIHLAPGDLVVLFSDGVTEARDAQGNEYGRERLVDVLGSLAGQDANRVLEDVMASVTEFALSAPQADDITALVMRYRGTTPGT